MNSNITNIIEPAASVSLVACDQHVLVDLAQCHLAPVPVACDQHFVCNFYQNQLLFN